MVAKAEDREKTWRKFMPQLTTSRDEDGNIKRQLSPTELDLLIYLAKEHDLDPLLGEIVVFKGRPYITEAGLMKKAIGSGQLDGMNVGAEYTDPDDKGDRWIATVDLWRKDASHPFTFHADQLEYANPQSTIWKKNLRSMTEKCCICRTIRHAFSISMVSYEEMAVDEMSGMSADEVQTAARAESEEARGEAVAADGKQAKAEAKEVKKRAAADNHTPEQVAQVRALYGSPFLFDKKRDGVNGSEAFLRKTFPDLDPRSSEQNLDKLDTDRLIAACRAQLAANLLNHSGIDHGVLAEILAESFPQAELAKIPVDGVHPPVLLDEDWATFLTELRWRAVDALHVRIGRDAQVADKHCLDRFEGQRDRTMISGERVEEYLVELIAEVGAANQPSEADQRTQESDAGDGADAAATDGAAEPQQKELLPAA